MFLSPPLERRLFLWGPWRPGPAAPNGLRGVQECRDAGRPGAIGRAVVEKMGEFLGAAHQETVKWQGVLGEMGLSC